MRKVEQVLSGALAKYAFTLKSHRLSSHLISYYYYYCYHYYANFALTWRNRNVEMALTRLR